MARVAVQSRKHEGISAKIVFQTRGPFVVVENTGFSTCKVRRFNKPQSVIQTFMNQDLYLLPSQVFPCENFDTPDLRYLSSDFAPVKKPFHKVLDFESYNVKWFDDEPASRPPTFVQDNYLPLVSPISVKPISESFTWDEMTSTWAKQPEK